MRVEVVRGHSDEVADEVVCIVRDDSGRIVGSSSVDDARIPLIGNRRVWVFRRVLEPEVPAGTEPELINATFDALAEERERVGGGPSGLCLLVTDRAVMRRLPEAVWPATRLLYAGYLADGTQVRLRWFEGASILT